MNVLIQVSFGAFALASLGVAMFAGYPVALWLASRSRGRRPVAEPGSGEPPTVSLIVAVRNGRAHVEEKIRNTLAIEYPHDRLEAVFYSDGSTDGTEDLIRAQESLRIRCGASREHIGKAQALNRAARESRGEILVFSDADALIEPGAVASLVSHFADPSVGGVCGQRVIGRDGKAFKRAQGSYVRFDSAIKDMENRLGRITSNDGKLYAIRRRLFRPVAAAVTDDLWVCLNVIDQGHEFLFDPEARASIRVPSRSPGHEISRRRRIVTRSLHGILLMRRLLNPFRHGLFAIGLLLNKVMRRLLPVCLLVLLASTIVLAAGTRHPAALALLLAQAMVYGAAACDPLLGRLGVEGSVRRVTSVPFYFLIGNWGTLLGVADFLRGRKVSKWDPRKTDTPRAEATPEPRRRPATVS